MEYIINVGLDVAAHFADEVSFRQIHENCVLDTLTNAGYRVWSVALVTDRQYVSEDTLVVRFFADVDYATLRKQLRDIAQYLYQDCIAVCPIEDTGVCLKYGALCGYHAHEWGEFNPDYFIVGA